LPGSERSGAIAGASEQGGGRSTPTPDRIIVTIGLSLPLSGNDVGYGAPVRDGVLMAVAEANEQVLIPGYRIDTKVVDYRLGVADDRFPGAADLVTLAKDPTVVAVVGPLHTDVAVAQIPISNSLGLLECSPGVTDPWLTKGPVGASLRPTDRISFIRVTATEDLVAAGQAHAADERYGVSRVAVVDDDSMYGSIQTRAFSTEWKRIGGTVVGPFHVPDPESGDRAVVDRIRKAKADGVFYAGAVTGGAWKLRRAMAAGQLGDLPFIGGPAIVDGSASVAGSYIARAAETIGKSYGALPYAEKSVGGVAFRQRFEGRYGRTATSTWAEFGYACTQVIVAAIQAAAAGGRVDREHVRAIATDVDRVFPTTLGPMGFDAFGDTTLQIVSVYDYNERAPQGPDWRFITQLDVGRLIAP
jgi:branched-chain amino acid transport system substrate-binding protein